MRKKSFLYYVLFTILLYIVFLTVKPLLRSGYYPVHDDIQPIRLLEIDKCVRDYQIPCRWVPDMGYGYGYPQFNYYAPLPYYVMEIIHLSGFGILASIKIYLVLITIFSMWGFYKLSEKFWQSELAGFISALFYSLLPYRAVNLYVRGAVGEYTAQALIPLILLFSFSLIKEKRKVNILYFSVSLAFLWLTHTISAVMFTPFLIVWLVFLFKTNKDSKKLISSLKHFVLSLLGVFTLTAFFILPAFFERGFIHSDTLTTNYFDFRGHFLGIYQILFSNNWGYGSSLPGSNDQIMLGIGVMYWFTSLMALIIAWVLKKKRVLLLFLNLLAWIALFLTHSKSIVLWNNLPFMDYFQFPWRFNALAGIFFSLAIGYFAIIALNKYFKSLLIIIFTAILLIFYGRFFRPDKWLNITDSDKLSGKNWELAITISINDYLPIYTSLSPAKKAQDTPEVISGNVNFTSIEKGTDWQNWSFQAIDNSVIRAQIFYFPNWRLYLDGKETPIDYKNNNGFITFNVGKGTHTITLKLMDTPIRTVGNVITLLGFPIFLLVYRKYKYEE
jgi:6-pyruvoyl-tetrahydropterin synthase related domain